MNIIQDGIEEIPEDASLYYTAVVYLLQDGKYKEAFSFLEKALYLNYEGHTALYDFFPNLETQKAIYKIIQQYK